MKFKFKSRGLEHRAENLEWKNILLQRKLLAAAESSSSAASGSKARFYNKTAGNDLYTNSELVPSGCQEDITPQP